MAGLALPGSATGSNWKPGYAPPVENSWVRHWIKTLLKSNFYEPLLHFPHRKLMVTLGTRRPPARRPRLELLPFCHLLVLPCLLKMAQLRRLVGLRLVYAEKARRFSLEWENRTVKWVCSRLMSLMTDEYSHVQQTCPGYARETDRNRKTDFWPHVSKKKFCLLKISQDLFLPKFLMTFFSNSP